MLFCDEGGADAIARLMEVGVYRECSLGQHGGHRGCTEMDVVPGC